MNHYCTYFDAGFLVHGLALLRSIGSFDPEGSCWVLALDDKTAAMLRAAGLPKVTVLELGELEAADPELLAARSSRSKVEYYFTLSPCLPHWILQREPGLKRITYVDADMMFFSSPEAYFREMSEASASVMMTRHGFPDFLKHYGKHGLYNVGILSFANDEAGRGCLNRWREQCIEWCHDRLEEGRYADQKYLDEWPARLGSRLKVCDNPGVNLAPWNWMNHTYAFDGGVQVGGVPLVLYHFARFRPICGDWFWSSGLLDYGVMPRRLRNAIYAPYWKALEAARRELRRIDRAIDFSRRPARMNRAFLGALPFRILFGTDWVRIDGCFYSFRFGLGRYSGRLLALLRRLFRK